MAVSDDQIEFMHELFEGLGNITSRKMMGGLSVYSNGEIFSILSSDGQIFLKAKGALARELEAEGCSIFTMSKDGKEKSMGYWTLPDAALDDPEVACEWGLKALRSPDR